MPRKPVIISCEHPYHVTARCLNREWFDLPMESVWSIMEDYLFLISVSYKVRIHSFVLMSNHIHLLVSCPENNISEALRYFLTETSRELGRLSGRVNQTWGSRNYKSLVSSYQYYLNVYKYIYSNPTRAGAATYAEEYPFSTLAGLCGQRNLFIPLAPDDLLFNPTFDDSVLRWINTPSSLEALEEVRKALRRPKMEFRTLRSSGKPNPWAEILI